MFAFLCFCSSGPLLHEMPHSLCALKQLSNSSSFSLKNSFFVTRTFFLSVLQSFPPGDLSFFQFLDSFLVSLIDKRLTVACNGSPHQLNDTTPARHLLFLSPMRLLFSTLSILLCLCFCLGGCLDGTKTLGPGRRHRGTKKTGNPQPLQGTKRRTGTRDGANGTLVAPVPAARRMIPICGRKREKSS